MQTGSGTDVPNIFCVWVYRRCFGVSPSFVTGFQKRSRTCKIFLFSLASKHALSGDLPVVLEVARDFYCYFCV